jgi:hypothetical protein
MRRARINVSIERLVLDGLPIEPGQGNAVRKAVEAELSRLLVDGGIGHELASGGAVPSVPGGSIEIGEKSHPRNLGRQIAGAVYGGLNR